MKRRDILNGAGLATAAAAVASPAIAQAAPYDHFMIRARTRG